MVLGQVSNKSGLANLDVANVRVGEAVTPWYPSYILMIDSDDPLLPSKNTPETPTPSK